MKLLIVVSFLISFSAMANDCSTSVDYAKSMIETDGTVANENQFMKAASAAINQCSDLSRTRNIRGLSSSISSIRSKCDQSANRGLSELYRGTCYLKIADLADFIIGH